MGPVNILNVDGTEHKGQAYRRTPKFGISKNHISKEVSEKHTRIQTRFSATVRVIVDICGRF